MTLLMAGCSQISSDKIAVVGVVVDKDGQAVQGATVRFRGKPEYTMTDVNGRFSIVDNQPHALTYLTAFAPGYFITQSENPITLETQTVTLTLRRLAITDNVNYEFVSALRDPQNEQTCAHCHSELIDDPEISLPVDEWLKDAHAFSARNPRFLSLYNGTSLDGKTSSPTVYTFNSSLAINQPFAPSLAMGEAGPGFRLDFPASAGNCASCHVPIAALSAAYTADPNHAEGVAAEGVTCDFCHKISDITLTTNGLPMPGMTGVLSYGLKRPAHDEQVFFGPFDDSPGDDVYLPLQEESQFCAGCHHAEFWGVTVYNSFGEWLDSPYNGVTTCQDCHMPQGNTAIIAQVPPDNDTHVPLRDPQTIFSHQMPGALDIELLQQAATVDVNAMLVDGGVQVDVVVSNTGTGHHLPTGNPLRNMILLITAQDKHGQYLPQLSGSIIPDWGGVGDSQNGYYAGLAGVGYARILADFYTDESPTYAYWRQTYEVSDNRIPAFESDESSYLFAMAEGDIRVDVKLILRRAFIELMDVKAWDTPDVVMLERELIINNE